MCRIARAKNLPLSLKTNVIFVINVPNLKKNSHIAFKTLLPPKGLILKTPKTGTCLFNKRVNLAKF